MFILDKDKLHKGDIILMRDDSPESKKICRIQKSLYSHALLYLGESSCIESYGKGVHSENIQRMLFQEKDLVCVLRVKNSINLERIIVNARNKVGTSYDSGEARKSLKSTKYLSAKEENRQYCTRFIAQAYQDEINLVENIDYCTINDFIQSAKLIKVKDYLKKASYADIQFANSDSPIQKQAEITTDFLHDIRQITLADIQTLNQVIEFLIKNKKFDKQFSNILRKSGYLLIWKEIKQKTPYYYSLKSFLEIKDYLDVDEANFIHQHQKIIDTETMRYQKELETFKNLTLTYKFEYFNLYLELYKHLLRDLRQQQDVLNQIRAYLENTNHLY